jgi:hypothetical protein
MVMGMIRKIYPSVLLLIMILSLCMMPARLIQAADDESMPVFNSNPEKDVPTDHLKKEKIEKQNPSGDDGDIEDINKNSDSDAQGNDDEEDEEEEGDMGC